MDIEMQELILIHIELSGVSNPWIMWQLRVTKNRSGVKAYTVAPWQSKCPCDQIDTSTKPGFQIKG